MKCLRFLLLVMCLGAQANAQPSPRIPTTLPSIDWNCFASFTVGFAGPNSTFQELGLDGDNLKKPRIALRTIDNRILKVIENPTDAARRKEYAVEMFQMTEDFSKQNPVFAWREDKSYQVKIYTFNVNDKILSLVQLTNGKVPHQNVVHVCK
jgi:hypothetical protein